MNRTQPKSDTETIWREFYARLRAFVSRRVRHPADVDDILQEVFVRIHRGVDSVEEREKLPAWIFQITRNAIVDHFRARSRAETATEEIDVPVPAGEDSGGLQELSELSACIEPMTGALPERYGEAIRMTELNGLTQIEAAQRSGLSSSGMKSRVQRARRQLKDMLLECCRVELDRRGGIVNYAVRDIAKSPCGPCGSSEQGE